MSPSKLPSVPPIAAKATLITFTFPKHIGVFHIVNPPQIPWDKWPIHGFLFSGYNVKIFFVPYALLQSITVQEFDSEDLARRQLIARGEPYTSVMYV